MRLRVRCWMRGRKCLRVTRFTVGAAGFQILGDYCGTCGKTWDGEREHR